MKIKETYTLFNRDCYIKVGETHALPMEMWVKGKDVIIKNNKMNGFN